ncbi:MAG: hypothetical protein J7578_03030 [Chitinophagaceae bacterium]|nr:hypothetical protein [Chitinophagaceae bacterium]
MKKHTMLLGWIVLLGIGCGAQDTPKERNEKKQTDSIAPVADLTQEEKQLVNLYSDVTRAGMERKDSAELYASRFADSLNALVNSHSGSLQYPFHILRDSSKVYIETAPGGAFRIYSWDTWTGGTMSYFDGIWQWKSKNGIHHRTPQPENGDPGNFCSKIYTVNIKGREYYLAILNGIYSSKDVSQSVQAFTIGGDQLIDTVTIFNTGSKQLNRIDVNYDFFSVVDRPERPVSLIRYDEKNKALYIPVVNDQGQVTPKHLVYELKEDGFMFRGVE